jgi:hypothetical protein
MKRILCIILLLTSANAIAVDKGFRFFSNPEIQLGRQYLGANYILHPHSFAKSVGTSANGLLSDLQADFSDPYHIYKYPDFKRDKTAKNPNLPLLANIVRTGININFSQQLNEIFWFTHGFGINFSSISSNQTRVLYQSYVDIPNTDSNYFDSDTYDSATSIYASYHGKSVGLSYQAGIVLKLGKRFQIRTNAQFGYGLSTQNRIFLRRSDQIFQKIRFGYGTQDPKTLKDYIPIEKFEEPNTNIWLEVKNTQKHLWETIISISPEFRVTPQLGIYAETLFLLGGNHAGFSIKNNQSLLSVGLGLRYEFIKQL